MLGILGVIGFSCWFSMTPGDSHVVRIYILTKYEVRSVKFEDEETLMKWYNYWRRRVVIMENEKDYEKEEISHIGINNCYWNFRIYCFGTGSFATAG